MQGVLLNTETRGSFTDVGALATNALGHASRQACDELLAAGIVLADVDATPLESRDAVTCFLCLPEPHL